MSATRGEMRTCIYMGDEKADDVWVRRGARAGVNKWIGPKIGKKGEEFDPWAHDAGTCKCTTGVMGGYLPSG